MRFFWVLEFSGKVTIVLTKASFKPIRTFREMWLKAQPEGASP
jgi:hypothetical protein